MITFYGGQDAPTKSFIYLDKQAHVLSYPAEAHYNKETGRVSCFQHLLAPLIP